MHRLEERTKKMHDQAESMGHRSNGHALTIKRLQKIDRDFARQHPQINVSLEKKYKAVFRLAHGLGRAVDGTTPAHLVTGVKKT